MILFYKEDELHRSSNMTISDYVELEPNKSSIGKSSKVRRANEAIVVSCSIVPGSEEDELEVLSKLERADKHWSAVWPSTSSKNPMSGS